MTILNHLRIGELGLRPTAKVALADKFLEANEKDAYSLEELLQEEVLSLHKAPGILSSVENRIQFFYTHRNRLFRVDDTPFVDTYMRIYGGRGFGIDHFPPDDFHAQAEEQLGALALAIVFDKIGKEHVSSVCTGSE